MADDTTAPDTAIHTPDTLKTIREALCLAQSALHTWPCHADRAPDRSAILGRLIADIDRQRPQSPDGTHTGRGLCTPTCGCEPQSKSMPFVQRGCPAGFSTECSKWTANGTCQCAAPTEAPETASLPVPAAGASEMCSACGEPESPTHDARLPGPTVLHRFRPAPAREVPSPIPGRWANTEQVDIARELIAALPQRDGAPCPGLTCTLGTCGGLHDDRGPCGGCCSCQSGCLAAGPGDPAVSVQPDGIAYDSDDLPAPDRAARRVREFLEWYGDGRIWPDPGVVDGGERTPLYARDLQVLADLPTWPVCARCGCRLEDGDDVVVCKGQVWHRSHKGTDRVYEEPMRA